MRKGGRGGFVFLTGVVTFNANVGSNRNGLLHGMQFNSADVEGQFLGVSHVI
jgi:hypothetical protein